MTETTTSAAVETTPVAKKSKPAKKTPAVSAKTLIAPSSTALGDKKVTFVKLLRKLAATSQKTARTLTDLAEKAGVDRAEVYGYIHGTSGKAGSSPTCLAATSHVAVVSLEEGGLAVYLTAKGKKTNFAEPPFVRANRSSRNGQG